MNESILTSTKIQLSLMPEDESFDQEIIIFINAAFARLTLLGVGPRTGFSIYDDSAVWSDFVVDITQEAMCKTYIFLKVKSLFDAPTNSSLSKHMEEQIKEYEYLLKIEAEDDADE